MGFTGSKTFLAFLFWLLVVTLVLQTIGLVVDNWWNTTVDLGSSSGIAHGGLWMVCLRRETVSYDTCAAYEPISDIEDWWVACRGLALGGSCLIFLAIVCCFSAIFSNGGKWCRLVCAILCFLAFGVITAEWALFVDKVKKEGWDVLDMWPPEDNVPVSVVFALAGDNVSYHTSFIITIIADVLSLLCGILALVSWVSNPERTFPV